jgi:hypothetical protein
MLAIGAHNRIVEPINPLALPSYFSGSDPDEIENGASSRRFATTRLADQPERLPLANRKADAVNGPHGAMLAAEKRPAGEREVDREIANFEKRRRLNGFGHES